MKKIEMPKLSAGELSAGDQKKLNKLALAHEALRGSGNGDMKKVKIVSKKDMKQLSKLFAEQGKKLSPEDEKKLNKSALIHEAVHEVSSGHPRSKKGGMKFH